ncbi:PREDICTED: uncharacterized protein C17orf59 homolog isoform X2 [Ceratosolen solmsi marchali]|nr:PREDICTED: uncharacterized protein C17orf59 homolog isoform X2 [Ceratosolen solmsi marchali]XP_011495842.1 PREDICTED: uncharacterized protein C17orf59 homolog isoform X2 [Ceratosolen solmsi marchali]
MTESYSEISFDSQLSPPGSDAKLSISAPNINNKLLTDCFDKSSTSSTRPDYLNLKNDSDIQIQKSDYDVKNYGQAIDYLQSEGTVIKDGNLVLFVTEDLENKIKLSSPIAKKGDTQFFVDSRNSTSGLYRQALTPLLPPLDHNILNELENEARKVATSVDSITENLAAILHSASALTVGCLETYRDTVCKTCDTVDYNIKSMYQLMAKCEELSKSMNIIYKIVEKIKDMKKMLELFENTMNI